ncbi:hypothetical protein [Nocardiopsis sp. NPDC055824]
MPVPLTSYIEEMRAELARVDAKASMLIALTGAGLAVLSPVLSGEGAGHWVVRAGAVLLVAALLVLLAVVRPQLARAPFAALDADPAAWAPEEPRERAVKLAAVTSRKFRLVRRAVDLLVLAVLLVGAGLICIGVTA